MKTTKEVQQFLKDNGFNLSVRKCTGTLKQYFMIGGRKKNGIYPNINTQELTDFLNIHFKGFANHPFNRHYSYNGGLSTLIQR